MKDKQTNIEHDFNISPSIDPSVFHEFQRISKKRSEEKTRDIPVLKAVNITKKFDDNLVIPGLNFTVEDIEEKSEIITMLGPSGCGKSTILNLIAGLTPPSSGELYAIGKKIDGPGMDRGMIFQKYSSFPFLTVIDNISYPLIHVKKMNKKTSHEKAKYWIDKMCLTGAEYKYPNQLSGGMQQRVAIARTLCMDARTILMDEPFGALDRKIRWEMQDLMAEIVFLKPIQEITVIFVTHDISEAVFLGDRVWIIDKGSINEQQFIDRPEEPARIAQGKKYFLDIVSYFNEKIDNLVIKKDKK